MQFRQKDAFALRSGTDITPPPLGEGLCPVRALLDQDFVSQCGKCSFRRSTVCRHFAVVGRQTVFC